MPLIRRWNPGQDELGTVASPFADPSADEWWSSGFQHGVMVREKGGLAVQARFNLDRLWAYEDLGVTGSVYPHAGGFDYGRMPSVAGGTGDSMNSWGAWPAADAGYIPWRMSVPSGAGPGTPLPLIIYMHGFSGTPIPDDESQVNFLPMNDQWGEWIKVHGPTTPALCIFPQTPQVGGLSNALGGGHLMIHVVDLIPDYLATLGYAVTPEQIYIKSYSAGGTTTYKIFEALTRMPKIAAACVVDGQCNITTGGSSVATGEVTNPPITTQQMLRQLSANILASSRWSLMICESKHSSGGTPSVDWLDGTQVSDQLDLLGKHVTRSSDTFAFGVNDRFVFADFLTATHTDVAITVDNHPTNTPLMLAWLFSKSRLTVGGRRRRVSSSVAKSLGLPIP